jgi:5-methylthioadenosine/S-adenosylhomocysteine deaminase
VGTIVTGAFLILENSVVKKNHGLAFENGEICKVLENTKLLEKYPNFDLIDCSDQILSPGFVNAHMHLYGVLSHGIQIPSDITDFKSFLEDFWWPLVEDRIDSEMISVTARTMALELLDSGVTALCDVLEAPMAVPGALFAAAEALDVVGIRSVLSIESSERINTGNGLLCLEENMNLIKAYRDHPLISGLNCIHTSFTCSKDFIKKAVELSRETGSGIQLHLSESKYEPRMCMDKYNKYPVELYDELEFFDVPVLAAQGVKLEENEIDILSKYSVDMVHVPLSNCEVGGGISPVPDLLEKGLNVALGTDGYINNFFEVMRGAFLIHKAVLENPEIMPGETVYNMATRGGAKALQIPGCGILKEGSPADFITIKPSLLTPLNRGNIFTQLVLYCNPVNVKNVFVNGRQLKADGALVDINMENEYEAVRAQAARLWENNK